MHPSDHAELHRPWLAYLCLGGSMAMVGSYVALSKPLVGIFPVFLLAWLRFGIAAVAMLPWLRRPANEAPMSTTTRRLVFLESFLGNFLFSICMLYGVSMTSAVSAGVIMASIPAVIALLSWWFLGERIHARVGAAATLGFVGMALLSLSKNELSTQDIPGVQADFTHKAWIGNLLVFAAVVCEASYAVIGKRLTGALGPRRISALINLWGLVLVTPLGLWAAWSFDFSSVTTGAWLLLVFYALAASVWTVWLWMTGLRSVPAAQAGIFSVLLPVSATVVGVTVLGEKLLPMEMAAFGVSIAGILLATWPAKSPATAA
ncbi:DMT family transporter [Curvibacter sp. APW13]|uniref:DMT family transporter n=1 Tax=Curvibacter sp. APW13 TaxID=3077236 RepID=UPI0028DDD5EB|nr:DMT family transporter [Curvibacter sp. APW13]MDT8991254.1 DMT family transporter [Curvibacter sp. APW13]